MADARKQIRDMGLKAHMTACDLELSHNTGGVATLYGKNTKAVNLAPKSDAFKSANEGRYAITGITSQREAC